MELHRRAFAALLIGSAAGLSATVAPGGALAATGPADPLPSWTPGATKDAILDFVRATTTDGSPAYLAPGDRIASFDQDGTLWVEHPVYTQVMFCLDRVPALVRARPELKDREPFRTVLTGDPAVLAKLPVAAQMEVMLAVQSGMTVETFRAEVLDWLATARHPRWNRPYTELVYQPMLEVLRLLRARGFKTFIGTGGSAGFVRPYSDAVYGIPPEQVCGSAQPVTYALDAAGQPTLTRAPHLVLDNLGAGKIENFWLTYGRRPAAAFGNSSADDQEMLAYVKAGAPVRLSGLVVHDDPQREYAYGPAEGLPDTRVGTLSQEMYDMAVRQNWAIIRMKTDWRVIFPFER